MIDHEKFAGCLRSIMTSAQVAVRNLAATLPDDDLNEVHLALARAWEAGGSKPDTSLSLIVGWVGDVSEARRYARD